MTSRIKCWHSKSLSYAARVQFINSVLIGISSYWCQIFIIPKRVIRQINSICRSFLWFGIFDSHKPGKLKWEDVCKPIKVGGLGDAITQDEFLLGNAQIEDLPLLWPSDPHTSLKHTDQYQESVSWTDLVDF